MKDVNVYGFVEHNEPDISPDARVEYIERNKDYIPMYIDAEGVVHYNSWKNFHFLSLNRPWMVKNDGNPDYELDENNYKLKKNGNESDVSNPNYEGGAYAYIPKIYKSERMVENDRIVKFSFQKRDGYEAIGYIDELGCEHDGVWIPMFYGAIIDGRMRSISDTQPAINQTLSAQWEAIQKVNKKAKFFGGAIIETITDILILLCKTTDIQSVLGYGNMHGYDSGITTTHGVLRNNCMSGGGFYGDWSGRSLNKIFHSVVLGSYNYWLRDPYVMLKGGRVYVSPHYRFNINGENYQKTHIVYNKTFHGQCPYFYETVSEFGAIPILPCHKFNRGGWYDRLSINISEDVAVAQRFGYCLNGRINGIRALVMYYPGTRANEVIGAAIMFLG